MPEFGRKSAIQGHKMKEYFDFYVGLGAKRLRTRLSNIEIE